MTEEPDFPTYAPFPFAFDEPQGGKHELGSFTDFAKIANENSHRHGVAWRGQADAKWRLTSSAFRAEKRRIEYYSGSKSVPEDHAKDILTISRGVKERMEHASRAVQNALGTDKQLRLLYREDLTDATIHDDPKRYGELLTICQHYGMATPLLDVTDSAYVALYFAAWSALKRASSDLKWRETGRFAVWKIPANVWVKDLSYVLTRRTSAEVLANSQHFFEQELLKNPEVRLPAGYDRITISNVVPRLYRSDRLIAQQASFIRVTPDLPLDHVLAMMYNRHEDCVFGRLDTDLVQYTLPATEALDCLVHLTKMNVRPDTLFPDLTGQMDFINIAASHFDYSGMTYQMRGTKFGPFGDRE